MRKPPSNSYQRQDLQNKAGSRKYKAGYACARDGERKHTDPLQARTVAPIRETRQQHILHHKVGTTNTREWSQIDQWKEVKSGKNKLSRKNLLVLEHFRNFT